ncbi:MULTISPECIES: hypothetical protein [Nonomuraea]|uniref:DUF4190 domain-containing protein n=1 Tax=Nonomuraea ferruginea TaxID=46174 RepID=A0ABT4T1L5_9ACTN|nr:hypothetical protein [Nonomuraea ferruginea]MDA0643362.1 hypothetical protein [Nonomuraea ferruginea]
MIAKPPGWPFVIVWSTLALVIMYWASVPFWYGVEMLLAVVLVGLPLMVYWALRFALAADRGGVTGRAGRCLAPWLITWATVVALAYNAPFALRFSLSASALGAYAERIMERGPIHYESCEWAGLYRVCGGGAEHGSLDGVPVPGSAGFATTEWAIYSNTGFAWHPGAVPQETADDIYVRIVGDWYGYHGWDGW